MSKLLRTSIAAALVAVIASPAIAQQNVQSTSYFDGVPNCACEPVVGDCCDPCCTDSCCGLFGCGWFDGTMLPGVFDSLFNTHCANDKWSASSYLFGDGDSYGVEIGGWTQVGYHSNPTSIGNAGSFNMHPDQVNLHQGWLYAGRVADGSQGWDWGFRTDIIYGVDAADTQAFGNPPGSFDYLNGLDFGEYGWAIPQLYGELAYCDWSVIVGHFFTIVGYETVASPGNFFYSHSFTMYNSEPFTHTGVLASYKGVDGVTMYTGWTLGWDTGFDQRFSGNNYLGGFSLDLTEDVTFAYMNTTGNFGTKSAGNNAYNHSIVMQVSLLDDLNYVAQSDVLDIDGGDSTVGLNQYLFYDYDECVKLGTRFEWWKLNGQSYYGWTAGVNLLTSPNFRLRPEFRYNWVPGAGLEQGIFGVDGIFVF